MKRYVKIVNGDSVYIYDSKKKIVYKRIGASTFEKLSISLEQLGRFCPYSIVQEETDNDKYGVS